VKNAMKFDKIVFVNGQYKCTLSTRILFINAFNAYDEVLALFFFFLGGVKFALLRTAGRRNISD